MRIAVCFCGQIRTGVECSPNLIEFFGDLFPKCDFFIHTWNRNSYKPFNESRLYKRETIVNQNIIDKIIEIYNPKKIVVDNYYEIRNKVSFNGTTDIEMFGHLSPQWYSFMKCLEYKIQFEKENGFEYDYVVKLRPDIIFPLSRKLVYEIERFDKSNKDDIYIENVTPAKITSINSYIDDVYFVGSSQTMNIASLYYDKAKETELTSNYTFLSHLFNYKIKLLNTERKYDIIGNASYSVYRDECNFLSPLTQFNECFECEKYYFFNINTKMSKKDRRFVEDLVNYNEIDKNVFEKEGDKLSRIYVDDLTFITPKNKIKFNI